MRDTQIARPAIRNRRSARCRGRLNRCLGRIVRLSLFVAVALGACVMAFPFIWMALTSLKQSQEIYHFPITFLPHSISNFSNYQEVFIRQPFGRFILNSVVVSSGATLASLLFSSLAGYAFAKYQFPGKEIIFFGFILSVLMIPFQVIVIPLYLMYSHVHLNNTLLGVMGPNLISAFGVFIMRQFMLSVPDDYIDAARIDGLSEFGIFVQIVLPLSKPALATLGTVKFIWTWNEFLWPLIMVEDKTVKTITLGVADYVGMWFTDYGVVMAAATLSIIPPVIIFVFLQNLVVQGMTMTGLKG